MLLKTVAAVSALVLVSCTPGKKQYPKGTTVSPDKPHLPYDPHRELNPTLPNGGLQEGSSRSLSPEENARPIV